ncbi:MAG: hypothetical protein U5K69_25535 [Balneolaceae bacterium]|nr:hypothetical protein [Balneolaceae bacterium]
MARTIVRTFGTDRTSWGSTLTGFLVSIPVFLDVGFIILVPIDVTALARKSERNLTSLMLFHCWLGWG